MGADPGQANLDRLPATGATLIVGAPKHAGVTGGPCRLIALVSGQPCDGAGAVRGPPRRALCRRQPGSSCMTIGAGW